VVEKFFLKRKSALWLTIGSAAGFLIGGVAAWMLLQRRPDTVGMPAGADVVPQEAVMMAAFSTDRNQWQQLRSFGTPESQAILDQNLAQLRDRLLVKNGLNYQRDVQPWVGREITMAVLLPPAEPNNGGQAIQPYDPAALAAGGQSTVMVLPIADPDKAAQLLSRPSLAAGQDWVDRDYKGVTIREVRGTPEQAYAAAVVENRFVVVSTNSKAVEQVIDTAKGKPSVAQTPGYSQALTHLVPSNPFMQMYVNVPAATALTANNTSQPIPPQFLMPLNGNRGLAAAMTLEPEGVRVQGVSWIAPNQRNRLRVSNEAERMPLLLPADSLLSISGGNFRQFWQNYTQQPGDVARQGFLNPDTLRRSLNNLAGLDLDQDLVPWMNGEFALALVSSPTAPGSSTAKTGIVMLVQTSDRKAAEATFQRLDELMKSRHRFQVQSAQVEGTTVTNWTSPFTSLTVSHGWLAGDVAFLAVGPDVASTIIPAPDKPLAQNPLFQQIASTDLQPNNGQFFLELDRLSSANTTLPLPELPPENQAFLKAMRAIGLTSALQDGRTTRYDVRVLLRKGNAPGALPAPAPASLP
jgi:Protein of unknown function (DUF3352)